MNKFKSDAQRKAVMAKLNQSTGSSTTRWVSTDPWRGYERPIYAVAGSSDTGMWSDSPCPSNEVNAELEELSKYLKKHNIDTEITNTESSNAFMIKRWVVVPQLQYDKAIFYTNKYLKEHSTEYLHD